MRIILLFLLLLEFGFAKKVALVIGNSNYSKGYLANPINDAKLIRDTLKNDLNFDVTYKTDLSKYEMEKLIREFSASIGSNDIALFYYAGHGMQYNRLNYLIPLKANAVTEGQIPSVGVDVNYILGGMDRAKLAILLLDACRNNPFSRSFSRGGTRGLAQVSSNQQNYIISYATEAGAETQDGNGKNSPYALALKEFLTQPLEVSTLLKKVKNRVARSTSPQQIPYVDDRYVGEYRLSEGSGTCSKVITVPAVYRTVTEKVLATNGEEKKIVVPAKYRTVTKKVLVGESYKIYSWVEDGEKQILEPKFRIHKERVKVSDGTERYILDENNKYKKVRTPPKYKIVKVKIPMPMDLSKIPLSINHEVNTIPAKYKIARIQELVEPAKIREVLPTYKTVKKRVLVSPATQKTISVPCSEVN
ncbi:hypothetical protein MNB_SV-13-242 [hydrothermal vent metagenome]|uniref:Caspase family p20 domain-containing protein n=1 Tax=hydrothermal vent metagenome TaxID=652676 RepID=A0A1W1CWF2_9ZZZZ